MSPTACAALGGEGEVRIKIHTWSRGGARTTCKGSDRSSRVRHVNDSQRAGSTRAFLDTSDVDVEATLACAIITMHRDGKSALLPIFTHAIHPVVSL